MNIRLLIDYPEFWRQLAQDISAARSKIYLQTFSLEGDRTGIELATAIHSSGARDKKILADYFTKFFLSDRFIFAPQRLFDQTLQRERVATRRLYREFSARNAELRFTNRPYPTPRGLLARNHKKLIIIDDEIAYVGGINFSDHNAAWHDLMIRIKGESVADFLTSDFLATWRGAANGGIHKFTGGLTLYSFDGISNPAIFAPILRAIAQARRSILVISPYLSSPFFSALGEIAASGVTVQFLTPQHNNWRDYLDYARLETIRNGIETRLYPDAMSHLKALLIDDEKVFLGSSNFDYLSYTAHRELVAEIICPEFVAEFVRRVAQPDWSKSMPIERVYAAREINAFQRAKIRSFERLIHLCFPLKTLSAKNIAVSEMNEHG